VVVCCGCLAWAAVAEGASPVGQARTGVTIEVWPQGLFGYVTSPRPARCAEHAQLIVFEQQGRRQRPASDKRVLQLRAAGKPGAYQWATRRPRPGRFYVKVLGRPGCRSSISGTVAASPLLGSSGEDSASYPVCSPWVSQGTTTICRFPEMHLRISETTAFRFCIFGHDEGNCRGHADSGPPVWGRTAFGYNPSVQFFWNGGGRRSVTFVSYRPDYGNVGVAHIGGTVPSAGSPDFTVNDAFATDDRGYPQGNHFYTPDIPGQAAGEVGGPLRINFVNPGWESDGADVYIEGYLYLKR
jgi:hypothetical protein